MTTTLPPRQRQTDETDSDPTLLMIHRLTEINSEPSFQARAQMSSKRYAADQCITLVIACVVLFAICAYLISQSEVMLNMVQDFIIQDNRRRQNKSATTNLINNTSSSKPTTTTMFVSSEY